MWGHVEHVEPLGWGAVSALFAPNAGRRWREHRGPSACLRREGWGLVSAARVSVCQSGRAERRKAAGEFEEQTALLLMV